MLDMHCGTIMRESMIPIPLTQECPWCACKRIEGKAYLNSVGYKMWCARCTSCGAAGPTEHDTQDAINAWNKRPVKEEPKTLPIAKYKALEIAALRMWEMNSLCMCIKDLICIPCQLRFVLTQLKTEGPK